MTRQRLGQHFLADNTWRERILATLPAGANEVWVEIGAGHGEMTQPLSHIARRILAIETDPRLVEQLRKQTAEMTSVEVVPADVLSLDLARLAGPRFRVYGNLPYYITSPILRHLFRAADQIVSAHLVIQSEVAARVVATPGSRAYGYLSALCQFYSHPEIALRLPPGAFRPRPKVNSALVKLALPGARAELSISEEEEFLKFLRGCFRQKRRTLRNNLRALFSLERTEAALRNCQLAADARAEQLTLRQFADLFSRLES